MKAANARKGAWLPYLGVPLVWILDQASKHWADRLFGGVETLVPGLLALRVIHHRGGLFGWGWPVVFLWPLLTVLGLTVLVLLARRTPAIKKMRHSGFACMIGGALGNLTDRLVRGYVIDFFELRPVPVINLADGALVLGILLIAGDLFIKTAKEN